MAHSDTETARSLFQAFDKARIEADYGRAEEPNEAAFFYRHGWIILNGRGYCREECFPEMTFPRFPADQGLSD